MFRAHLRTWSLGIAVAAFAMDGVAATNELGWTLSSALKQIDRQSRDFESMLADAEVVAKDASGATLRSMSGRIYMTKNGDIRVNTSSPDSVVLLVTNREVQQYDSVRALVERYPLSKHKQRLEPYARLGFTATGKDLTDDYLVTMLGEDRLRGQRTLLLELTPKLDAERQVVGKITLWIDESSWMPARQVIEHVESREQLVIDYVGMARNLKLSDDLFRAKWPKGTQQIRR